MRLSQLELIAMLGAAAVVFWVGCDFIVFNDTAGGQGWSVDTSTGDGAGTTTSTTEGTGGAGTGGHGTGLACCSTCHGTADNPAPPPDFSGKSDPSLPTVGAHGVHTELSSSPWHAPIGCETCHPLPTNCSERQEGVHLNDVRNVVFSGPLVDGASYDNAADPTRPTCSNTWCHGSFLGEDAVGAQPTYREPVWTDSTGTYGRPSACGRACHTLPPKTILNSDGPDRDHPPSFVGPCDMCHTSSIAEFNADEPAFSVWAANGSLHINGEINMGVGGGGNHGPPEGGSSSHGGAGGASTGSGGAGGI